MALRRFASLLTLGVLAGCALPHASLRDGSATDTAADRSNDAIVDDRTDVAEVDVRDDVMEVDVMDVADVSDVVDAADVTPIDAADASDASDASDANDTGSDVRTDTGVDVRSDSGVDTGVDTGADSGVDTGVDSGVDTGVDSGVDTGVDTGVDVRSDTGIVRYRLGTPVTLAWRPDVPPGGVTVTNVRCGANAIVVGVNADVSGATNVLNGYQLACAPFNEDGTLGTPVALTNRIGGTNNDRTPRCGAGQVALMRSVRAGAVIDDVLLDCATLAPLLPPMPMEMVVGMPLRFTNENGGSETTTRCAVGSVLVGLDATLEVFSLANRVGRVRPVCAPIERF